MKSISLFHPEQHHRHPSSASASYSARYGSLPRSTSCQDYHSDYYRHRAAGAGKKQVRHNIPTEVSPL